MRQYILVIFTERAISSRATPLLPVLPYYSTAVDDLKDILVEGSKSHIWRLKVKFLNTFDIKKTLARHVLLQDGIK